jgi:hypothetical protein
MIIRIRPHQVFKHLGSDNQAHITIPTVPGTESLTVFTIDTLLLIAAARMVEAKSILEIGTGLGYTSLHLARNTFAEVFTIDNERKPCVFEGTGWDRRIARMNADVKTFPPLPADMVFCDINPTVELCRACTDLAFACSPKVIAWHDFENVYYPAQTENLNALAMARDIYFVEDTRICLWFADGRIL